MRPNQVELKHLKSFLAVAQEGSFTRAADSMHIAQPPLSRRISDLEKYLEVQLFRRSTRAVQLTPAGENLRKNLTEIVKQLENAIQECKAVHEGISGTIRIGYTGRASHTLLPRLIREIRQYYPALSQALIGPHHGGTLRSELLKGKIDLALCFLPLKHNGIDHRELSAIDFCAAIPDDHPLSGKKSISVMDLQNEPFVSYPRSMTLREVVDVYCQKAGFLPRVVQEADTSPALLCLIAAGIGLSITPAELQDIEPISGVVFRPLSPKFRKLAHGVAWMKNNHNPALSKILQLSSLT